MIKDCQVIALWKEFKKTKVIKISALKTGMNRKTASKYLNRSTLPSESKKDRHWKTCEDKLEKIWPLAVDFLKVSENLEAKALFEHLLENHKNLVEENQLRTFQRRVKQWRIQHGKNQEVYFDQETTPGKLAQLDWVDLNKLKITISGKLFKHKLIHFALNHSKTESASICRSESMNSIRKGIRKFLYIDVGKAPQILQVDNCSAATHRPDKDKSKRTFNDEYIEILNYYGIKAQKNNVRKPNENGVVESLNGHLKNKIIQALKIRGSHNFKDLQEYELFLKTIIDKANKKRKNKLAEELPSLVTLPAMPLPEYQELYVQIRNRSTVNIKKITYSVPSRLIGSRLKARIYENKIDLYSGVDLVCNLPRILGDRGKCINYRHVIDSLIKKPSAFDNYKHREELYPTKNFKKAFDFLTDLEINKNKKTSHRQRTLEYLRILKLAADNSESDVDCAINLILDDGNLELNIDTISNLILTKSEDTIHSIELIPDLNIYDQLFLTEGEHHERKYN